MRLRLGALTSLAIIIIALMSACGEQRMSVGTNLADKLTSSSSQIPPGYRTYTYFLSPSYAYTNELAPEARKKLEYTFPTFAKDIGDQNLAILPTDSGTDNISVAISKDVVDRINARYARDLSYNDGPFIVVLNHHP